MALRLASYLETTERALRCCSSAREVMRAKLEMEVEWEGLRWEGGGLVVAVVVEGGF